MSKRKPFLRRSASGDMSAASSQQEAAPAPALLETIMQAATTRREAVVKSLAIATATSALSVVPAVAHPRVAPVAPSPASDPLVKMTRQLRRAEQRWSHLSAQQDKAEAAARDAGFVIGRPFMTVGRHSCSSVAEIERAAADAGFSAERVAELAAVYRRRLAHQRRQRTAAGLAAIDAKERAADAEYWRRFRAVATTPAASAEGLAVKLRLIVVEIRDGRTKYGERLARGALADDRRLAAAAAARKDKEPRPA